MQKSGEAADFKREFITGQPIKMKNPPMTYPSVPREDVVAISAEDTYDTISEAKAIGKELIERSVSSIIVTTSKSHSRRARYIWKTIFQDQFTIRTVAAHSDPFTPQGWWKDGRQIRWVLAEYGAWLYLIWRNISFGNSGN